MDRLPVESDVGPTMDLEIKGQRLQANLRVPEGARGLVIFAHGSGSDRYSPRNRYVAGVLHGGGLATLLVDLLTPEEQEEDERTRRLRFDIDLLAERLVGATDWATREPSTAELAIGYFGSSTGAAAALIAAAERSDVVRAVVSRGGRTDLADDALSMVRAPTLMIVGGADLTVLELNIQSRERMKAPTALEVIPGAGHLFSEPGSLAQVAELARDWFVQHLGAAERTAGGPSR